MNRIVIIRLIAVLALFLIFWLGTRKMSVVPGRFQGAVEMGLDLVRNGIAKDVLGEKDGNYVILDMKTKKEIVFAVKAEEKK